MIHATILDWMNSSAKPDPIDSGTPLDPSPGIIRLALCVWLYTLPIMPGDVTQLLNAIDSGDPKAAEDMVGRIWDASGRPTESRFEGIFDVSFPRNGRNVLLAGPGPEIRILDAFSLTERFKAEHHEGFFTAAFSPDGKLVAAGSKNDKGELWVWDCLC